MRIDLLVTRGSEKLIVEVKGAGYSRGPASLYEQVARYLDAAGISEGIALVIPNSPTPMRSVNFIGGSTDKQHTVFVLGPSDKWPRY